MIQSDKDRRPIAFIDALNQHTTFAYDSRNNQTSVTGIGSNCVRHVLTTLSCGRLDAGRVKQPFMIQANRGLSARLPTSDRQRYGTQRIDFEKSTIVLTNCGLESVGNVRPAIYSGWFVRSVLFFRLTIGKCIRPL